MQSDTGERGALLSGSHGMDPGSSGKHRMGALDCIAPFGRAGKNRRGLAGRFLKNRSGVAAVEFAIVAPVFILLFMGMVAYGIYFGALHSLQQLAADAARASIAGLDEAERESIVTSFLDENAGGYVFINREKLAVEIGDNEAGTQFVVRLRYDAEDLPIWTLLEGLPLPGKTMARTSTIRVGGI